MLVLTIVVAAAAATHSQVARVFEALAAGERHGIVKGVKHTEGRRQRPAPLNTVELLKVPQSPNADTPPTLRDELFTPLLLCWCRQRVGRWGLALQRQ